MRQLRVATECGFCNFSLRRIIPPPALSLWKGITTRGFRKPWICSLPDGERKLVWGCGKTALIILGTNVAQKGVRNCRCREAAQFRTDCTFLHPCSGTPWICLQGPGSVPLPTGPWVAALLRCLTAACQWPPGTGWCLGFSTSALSALLLVLSVLRKKNDLDKFVGCLAC